MMNTFTPFSLKFLSPVFLIITLIKMGFQTSRINQKQLQPKNHKAIIFIAVISLLPMVGYTQTFTFSSTNPAIIGSTINQGASNQPIYAAVVQVTGSGWGGNFTKLTFTATGTFATTDINYASGVSGYKVWASTTNNLSTASQISNPYQAESSGTQVSITVNNKPFNVGETWYIWITADISSTAMGGHTLTVGTLTKDNFAFNSGVTAGTMYPAGTQIIGTKATYNSNGSYTFTVPPGVYSINVEAWGAGAGGNNNTNKGGGGGAYAGNSAISVNPGSSYTVTVGQGGTAGNDGQNSSFASLVIAAGAKGVNGGLIANSTGAIKFAGGNGGTSTNNGGAGGGGSGGAGGAGGNGGNSNNNNAGAGGLAGMGSTGGAGGVGGYCIYYSKWYQEWFPGNNGNSPGGGGGENSASGSGSGAGADGQVLISWTAPASMWYKADIGTSTTTDGAGISTWNDQSGLSNNATSKNTTPTYQTLGWNFNPSVSFSTGYFLTASNSIFDDMTFFTVYNTRTSGGGASYNCPTIIGGEVASVQDDYYLSLKDGKPLFKAKDQDDDGAISNIVTTDNFPRILSATHKKAVNGDNFLYINGNLEGSQNMGNRGATSLSQPKKLGIGNHYSEIGPAQFKGNISEVIGISSVFATSARQNLESYLAIKYGITLTHDYTNSASTSIYPIAGYSNDIAGLGRNDTWKLHQKVSASSNMASGSSRVVMATSNDFVNSNLDNSRTALTDGQYLIWGHNNGSTATWTATGSAPRDSIVGRVWKVVNTTNVGSVYFQIDLTGYTAENGIYRLLVDDNTDFTTGVTSYVLTNTSGNLYTTSVPVTFANGVRYFTIAQKSNYWKGTSTSTDWGTDTNWTAGEVPPTGAKVEYATATKCGVEAANNLVLDLSERTVSRVINATTWNLTIPAGKALTVNNSIITDRNPDRILIQTRTTTPEVANGTLIFHNSAANPVFGTVEMYSKAYIDDKADINGTQRYFWQYFGIPVESVTADPTLYGAYVRRSNEAGNDEDETYYWKELGTYDKLTKFLGYEICQPAAKKYTFIGQLVNTDFDSRLLAEFAPSGFLPVSNNGSSVDGIKVKYPGEHLFANAYTAAINVDKIEFGDALDKTVFLYNTGSYGQWVNNAGGNTGGTAEGQYLSIPQNLAGFSGIPGQIPSMSSFLVKTGEDKTVRSYIKINYNDALIKNTTIQRVKSVDKITNTDLISTRIDLTGKHYSDRMWIFTEPSCTRNFDNGWDGRKMLGSSLAPQIYAIEPDGDYQVNSVSDMNNTDLAFQAGDEVEYTIKFTHENIQRQYAGVYLVDLVENKTVDVSENGSTYTFATTQSDAPAKRFKILTRPYEKGAPDKEALVKIFTSPGRVFVQNLSTFKGECTLYDIAGRAIKNAPFEANAVTEVLSNLTPGAYVVNTITNGEKVSKRVIVQ
jgi:hypothetical protein